MELNDIKEKIEKRLSEITDNRGEKYYFDVKDLQIDIGDVTFMFSLDFDIDIRESNEITEVDIYKSNIQFSDFEANFEKKYISILETILEGSQI